MDAATNQPLEGVVVLAQWRLKYYLGEAQDGGALQFLEAVTNKEGRFSIPSWTKAYSPTRGKIEDWRDPELFIFKPGYRYKRAVMFSNSRAKLLRERPAYPELDGEDVLPSELDGHVFMLRPLLTKEQRAKSAADALGDFVGGVIGRRESRACKWASVSRFYSSVGNEYVMSGGLSLYPGRSSPSDRKMEILRCKQGDAYGWNKGTGS